MARKPWSEKAKKAQSKRIKKMWADKKIYSPGCEMARVKQGKAQRDLPQILLEELGQGASPPQGLRRKKPRQGSKPDAILPSPETSSHAKRLYAKRL